MSFAGSDVEKALEFGVVDLAADLRRKRSQPLAGDHGLVDPLLEIDPRLLLGVRQVRAGSSSVLLLLRAPVGAGDAGRGDEHDGGDALSLRPPTISDTRPPSLWPTTAMRLRIDVLAVGQEFHGRALIVRRSR